MKYLFLWEDIRYIVMNHFTSEIFVFSKIAPIKTENLFSQLGQRNVPCLFYNNGADLNKDRYSHRHSNAASQENSYRCHYPWNKPPRKSVYRTCLCWKCLPYHCLFINLIQRYSWIFTYRNLIAFFVYFYRLISWGIWKIHSKSLS